MKSASILPLSLLLIASACGNQPGNGDPQESPSTAMSGNRLVDEAPAGNGAVPDATLGVAAIGTQPAGSTSSAPGAATSGKPAEQATGGADGGRALGDRSSAR